MMPMIKQFISMVVRYLMSMVIIINGKSFLSVRQYLLEHSDTAAEKTTAAEWLRKLE